jgi:hypothetical protein
MRALFVAAALFAIATPALAEAPWAARIAQPSQKKGFVAAKVIWDCNGATCVSKSDTSSASDKTECHKLAREVGEVVAFVGSNGPLAADKLAECNGSVAKPK